MAKCELGAVDCEKADQCSLLEDYKGLKIEILFAKGGRWKYWAIQEKLTRLSRTKCPIEDELNSEVNLEDLPIEELARVGAKRF